jgi:hypothetical protein
MPSVPHIIIHALWGAVNTTFGMFGLRPVYALYVIIGLFSVGLIMQVRGIISERDSWTFDPAKTPRKREF